VRNVVCAISGAFAAVITPGPGDAKRRITR
jgi:hypothetical protein